MASGCEMKGVAREVGEGAVWISKHGASGDRHVIAVHMQRHALSTAHPPTLPTMATGDD
jgi:hypothetical protein